MKDVTNFVVKSGSTFYIDAEDINTGERVCNVKDSVQFMYKGQLHTAIVTEQVKGRNDDVHLLQVTDIK